MFKRIHVAGLLSAIAVAVVSGCGDPQLNQSRLEPLFVAQPVWSTAYAPGLVVVSQFPDLLGVESPRFVSSNPSVAAAGVIPADSQFGFDGIPAVRLSTGAPGTTDIHLFDGDVLVRTESVQVIPPAAWRFDFTLQNQVAPRAAAIPSDENIQILALAEVIGVVEFSRSGQFSTAEAIVATGKIESANELLLEVQNASLRVVGAASDELRFNQLSSGDLVSVAARGITSVGLQLTNGATVFSSGLESVFDTEVESLELIVSRSSDADRAEIAVYGVTEDGRALGLAPVVTFNGTALRPFYGRVEAGGVSRAQAWPWLFALPARGGTVEARWRDLVMSVAVDGEIEPEPACAGDLNAQVFSALEYTGGDGVAHTGTDAADALALDCLGTPNNQASDGCAPEFLNLVDDLNGATDVALAECVGLCMADVIGAITGQSLTPDCVGCYYGAFVSWVAVGCAPLCGADAECVRAQCAPNAGHVCAGPS